MILANYTSPQLRLSIITVLSVLYCTLYTAYTYSASLPSLHSEYHKAIRTVCLRQLANMLLNHLSHRRRIKTEEKAKVVAAAWGKE